MNDNDNMIDTRLDPNYSQRVLPEDQCPRCGERFIDRLVFDENGEIVTCSTCGTEYDPNDS
jgi:formylmethanofuran dehydrogenase subunit E